MNEWDGTPWGGTSVPAAVLPAPRDGMAQAVKAATGWQQFSDKPFLTDLASTPRKVMRRAIQLYSSHPWIGTAEDTVTDRVAGLPWHIEDQNDDEVDDETPNPAFQAIRDLLEKPQANIPPDLRQPGIATWRGLVSIISRHAGLCGVSYVHPDQVDTNRLPLALIYVSPDRVYPVVTPNGNLLGYRVDADEYGNGGVPFRPDELIPFYLRVPDWGATTSGLVERAALKARLSTSADYHVLAVLARGGRTPGLIAPKDGMANEGQFEQLERDLRTAIDGDPERRRDVLLRGPVDYQKMGADPEELGLETIWSSTKNDIFTVWQVPLSQAGDAPSRGLNGSDTASHEYEQLMAGPVHSRVVVIQETLQTQLLDRWKSVGLEPELEIEEPTFDDDSTPYELANKASNQPLTWNERRAILNLDPLPEYGPTGEPLGLAIYLPMTFSEAGQGPEEGASENNPFPNAPKPTPPPPPPPPPVNPVPPTPQIGPGTMPMVAKAGFLGLRETVDRKTIPAVQKSVRSFLAKQREDIVSRIASATLRQLKDVSYWFRGDVWDRALRDALKPHVASVAETVTVRTGEILRTGKAKTPKDVKVAVAATEIDPFVAEVERLVLSSVGSRISGINGTTRDAVANVVQQALAESLTAPEIAERVRAVTAFDEARSELIARTESMFAYNSAAIASYQQYGVERVRAIDGDGDEECASRDGQIYSLEEASSIEDHPNGTLDWAPYFEDAA